MPPHLSFFPSLLWLSEESLRAAHAGFHADPVFRYHRQERVDDAARITCAGQRAGECRQFVLTSFRGYRRMEVREKGPFPLYGTPYTQNDLFGVISFLKRRLIF